MCAYCSRASACVDHGVRCRFAMSTELLLFLTTSRTECSWGASREGAGVNFAIINNVTRDVPTSKSCRSGVFMCPREAKILVSSERFSGCTIPVGGRSSNRRVPGATFSRLIAGDVAAGRLDPGDGSRCFRLRSPCDARWRARSSRHRARSRHGPSRRSGRPAAMSGFRRMSVRPRLAPACRCRAGRRCRGVQRDLHEAGAIDAKLLLPPHR